MAVIETYISAKVLPKLLKPLVGVYKKVGDVRRRALIDIDDNFSDSRALAKYYIEPNCQQVNPADECEDGAISTVQTNIFKTINNFLNRDIVVRDSGASQMFILADAGMGKTSLLMILKLTHLMKFWPQGYQCKLLKLGADTLDEIAKTKDKSNTLLLLDSLDEDPQCKDGKTTDRLIEVLEKTKTFKRVIITCRTQFFPQNKNTTDTVFNTIGKINFANFTCPLVYLSLFDDEQVEAYLKVRYPKGLKDIVTFNDNPKVEQACEALKKTDSLQFRPFLLSHIEDILEAAQAGANEYELYYALIDKWLDREVGKLRKKHGKTVNKDDLFKVCAWLAETMCHDDKDSVAPNTIKQLCYTESHTIVLNEEPDRVVKELDDIDIGTNSLLNLNSAGEYRFCHLSIREFIVIHGVATELLSGKDKPFTVGDKMQRFLSFTQVKKPFHFLNQLGGYLLIDTNLAQIEQLNNHSLKDAEVDLEAFLSDFVPDRQLIDIVRLELRSEWQSDSNIMKQNEQIAHRLIRILPRLRTELRVQLETKQRTLLRAELRAALRTKLREELKVKLREELRIVIEVELLADLLEATNTEQLIERLVARLGCTQLQKINLGGIKVAESDFSSSNLSGANLIRVDLSGANLANTYLTAAELTGAKLSNIDLTEADLVDADLTNSDLSGACLIGANLSGANLSNVILKGANLTGADLTGAILTGAKMPEEYKTMIKQN
jgi:uncharacterized protein YjbI with pentapeptide repeats